VLRKDKQFLLHMRHPFLVIVLSFVGLRFTISDYLFNIVNSSCYSEFLVSDCYLASNEPVLKLYHGENYLPFDCFALSQQVDVFQL
jgi:hypothetical protein